MLRANIVVLLASVGTMVAVTGCAPPLHSVVRNEMQLASGSTLTKEGLTFDVKVLDEGKLKSDIRLYKSVNATQGGAKHEMHYMLLAPPVFAVSVTNNTGHIARMQGIVIKLIDAATNSYDPVTKDLIVTKIEDSLAQVEDAGIVPEPASKRALKQSASQLKLLDPNVQILPGMTERYLLSFDLPTDGTYKGLNDWLADQTTLTLKIFEVPSEVDQAANVTKRVHFEFPILVRSYEDTFKGTTLQSSREIGKLDESGAGFESVEPHHMEREPPASWAEPPQTPTAAVVEPPPPTAVIETPMPTRIDPPVDTAPLQPAPPLPKVCVKYLTTIRTCLEKDSANVRQAFEEAASQTERRWSDSARSGKEAILKLEADCRASSQLAKAGLGPICPSIKWN